MRKICSIIFYDGWIDISPTVINLAQILAEKGYEVTIFGRKNKFIISEQNDFLKEFKTSVVYFNHPSSSFSGKYLWKLLLLLKLGSLIPLIDVIIFFFQIKIYKFRHVRDAKDNESLLIGIDTNGAVTALMESILNNKNIVYLSLELNREKKFRIFDKVRLYLDRIAYKRAKCVIVQDEDRFRSLSQYSRFDHPTVFYLPNSTFKLESSATTPTDNYFRQLFNLDDKTYPYIVAQAGMVNDKVFCRELAEAFAVIKLGCALIFHERHRRSPDDPYIRSLRELNSNNLFLSLEPVPYKNIDRIYSAINIGIACYRRINENFAQISKASGKLAQYLQYGIPVLMNDLDSLKNLNEEYKFGVVIKDPASFREVSQALKEIIENYEYYRTNALICFEKEFDFRAKAEPFLNFLETKILI